jgi:hypothetical protein
MLNSAAECADRARIQVSHTQSKNVQKVWKIERWSLSGSEIFKEIFKEKIRGCIIKLTVFALK